MQVTTDNQSEIFDMVDEDDNEVGQVNRKEANMNPKIIHRAIGVAVFNKKGEMFLQRRSMTKDTDPGKWTISCSGHVGSAGPVLRLCHPQELIYEEAAHRELLEELGVDLTIESVAKYICYAPHETEMTTLFKAYAEGPFKLHPQEIEEGKFLTRGEFQKGITSGEIELSFMGREALMKLGWL